MPETNIESQSTKEKNRNKKWGLTFLITPLAGIIFTLVLFPVVNTALTKGTALLTVINYILFLLGTVCTIGMIIGIPLGIIFLLRESINDSEADPRSGKGNLSIVPEEIKKWNWAAAFLPTIWGLTYRVWIGFWFTILEFILGGIIAILFILNVAVPFIIFIGGASILLEVILIFIFGFRGNVWAWRKTKWKSVEDFKAIQKKWKIWGIFFGVLSIISLLNSILSLANPNAIQEYLQKIQESTNAVDYQSEIRDYNKEIALNPKNGEAYFNRGLAKYNLNDYQGAIQDYNKVIELEPNNLGVYTNRGIVKYALNDYQGAIQDYNKVIELDPNDLGVYYNRGIAKDVLNDYQGAIQDYNKDIELNPNDFLGYYYRGLVYIKLGQKETGCLDFKKSKELGFTDADDQIKTACQ